MTEKIYRHRLPFSTLAEAQAANPILFEGERWTEKDPVTGRSTGRQKVGDGVETPPGSGIAVGTAFNDLPFEPSAASSTASSVTFTPAGTIAATNVQAAVEELDNDARMSNARTPTTHATSHGNGGSDPLTLAQSQVSGLAGALAGKADTSALGTAAFTAATDYAPAAQGVTGGNSHDHNGGDGAQIAYSSLSGLPPLGTAAATDATAYAPAPTTNNAFAAGTNAQGQGLLTADVNIITSAAANPGAVTLPADPQNRRITVVNRTGHNIVVYPASGDSIDGGAANAGVTLGNTVQLVVTGASATEWFSTRQELTNVGTLFGTGTGVITFLQTPNSANLRAALTDDTGSGLAYFQGGDAGTPSAINLANGTALPTSGITNFNADIRAQIEAALLQGTNITITPSGSGATRQFTFAASGGGSLTVQDEGTTLSTSVTTINFTGAGATATGAGTVTVDIPGGGGISDGDKGDITVSGSGTTWTIDNGAVTLAKQANLTTQRVIGRNTAGSGVPEEVTLSQLLDWASNTRGSILFRGATGWQALGPGPNGWFLQSGDVTGDPSWFDNSDVAVISGGFAQFAGTSSSSTLRDALTNPSGTGLSVFNNGPTLIAPILGTPASVNLSNATALPLSAITMSTARLLGRSTAGSGGAEEISLGPNMTLVGGVLNSTGGSASAGGSNTQIQFNDGGALAGAANVKIKSDNLQLTVPSSAPGAADASSAIIYPVAKAQQLILATRGPIGTAGLIQPALFGRNAMMFNPQNGTVGTGGASFQVAWTSNGTVSHPSPAATNLCTAQRRTRYGNVVTTQNQQLGPRMNTDAERVFHRGNVAGVGGFFYWSRFSFGAVPASTIRVFSGLQGNSAFASVCTSDTPAGPYCGLVHRTIDPLTGANAFLFATHDGTNVTRQSITLASTIAADTMFDFWMYCEPNGTSIYFQLDDLTGNASYTHTATLTLPGATVMMNPQCQGSNGTANTTANAILFEVEGIYAYTP